ncbi:GNAT family N-acetyltransferase [Propionibacteriaceae bacterium Y1700]|uniref:GNAT family N-acetyltransferase n=1 Tax=Microlunatus sp. Y1700 TaxID=3418487 RepID=UPI003DA746B0
MAFPECVPVLTDGVVRLRPHAESDIERIVEQCTDPVSLRWTQVPRGYTAAMAREWLTSIAEGWDSGGDQLWAIEAVDDAEGRFLGSIDLRPRGAGRAEVGYGLHLEGRGRGLMRRALRLLCQHWFDTGGQRMDWYSEVGNFDSLAVALRTGFTFVTKLPEHIADGEGRLVDTWFASLGRQDTFEPRAPWITPPVLAADGVRLRPWRVSDVESVETPDHPPHFVPAGAIPSPDNWEGWLLRRRLVMARGTSTNWCIADADTDRALGEVLIFVHDGALAEQDTAELGYYVYPSARGRGVAGAATRLAVDHAFAPADKGGLGLRRLVAETAADNSASIRVLTTLGFTRWGHEKGAVAPDGSIGPADHWERYAS